MRVTKVILEEENKSLRETVERLRQENLALNQHIKLLNGVIGTYSKMPSLIVATERISDALAHTVDTVFQLHKRS